MMVIKVEVKIESAGSSEVLITGACMMSYRITPPTNFESNTV
jgi:hypothetical protein